MGTADMHALPIAAPASQNLSNAVLTNRQRFETAVKFVEVTADLVTVTFSVLLSYWIYQVLHIGRAVHYQPDKLITAAFAFAILFVFLMDRSGAYAPANSLLGIRETERVLRVSSTAFGFVFVVTFLWAEQLSRGVLAGSLVIAPLALAGVKQLMLQLVRNLHGRGYGIQNVVIYGAGATGRRVFSALQHSPKLGLRPVAILDDDEKLAGNAIYGSGYRRQGALTVTGGPLTRDLIRRLNTGLVLIGIPSMDSYRRDLIAAEAFAAGCAVAFVPQLGRRAEATTGHVDIDGVLVSSLSPHVSKYFYEFGKRFFDVAGSLVLLLLTAPAWAVIAMAIQMDSAGPIFFCHTRIGKNGVPFELYKFRSMRVDAAKYGFHPQKSGDPRVTRVGRWLRRTSLDELPQLINVLRGDMSLVGPRPEMPFIVERYNQEQRQRLSVVPGITGLWQLSADRAFSIHESLQYDLYYIRHRNFFMDVALLLHTAFFAMRGV